MAELLAIGKDLKGLALTPTLNADGSGTLKLIGDGFKPELRLAKTEVASVLATLGAKPVESLPPPPVDMVVAVDTGGWTGNLHTELIAAGITKFRVQRGAAPAVPAGHIASVIAGGGGSIGGINPAAHKTEVTQLAELGPESIEDLNEPGGPWDESDPTNYTAYVGLLKAAREGVEAAKHKPALICSWDGGVGGSQVFGLGVKNAGGLQYVDGVTVHPYGGSAGQHGGALGDRGNVERAYKETGLPVYVTEVGWPQNATSDSQAWTKEQQAENIANFIAWARSTGYVRLVVVFNAVDYTGASYGIEHANRAHKLAFAALATAAK